MAKHTLDRLNDLLRAELDILGVIDDALHVSELPEVRAEIERERRRHEAHAQELRRLVLARGGTPATRRHFVGVLMSGSARIGAHDDASALRFVRRDLERIASRFEGALFDDDLEPDERAAYERILAEEREAMRHFDRELRNRGWEEIPPPWPIP